MQHGAISGFSYRGRKLGIRRWRNGLLRSSQFMPHYRSVFFQASGLNTGVVQGFGIPARRFPELGTLTTDGFWTAAGGLVALDRNVSAPDFLGDITLRGGKIGCAVTVADSVTDVIYTTIYLVFVRQGMRDPADFTSFTVSKPYGWDPETDADFVTGCGKVLKKWSAILNYNNNSLLVEHRLKPRKIDRAWYLDDSVGPASTSSNQFAYIIHAVNMTSTTNVTVSVSRWHNLSFSADADTVV